MSDNTCKQCGKPASWPGTICSDECQIAYLRAALAERDAEIEKADALLHQIQQWMRDGFMISKRADVECSPTVSREHGISFLNVFPSTYLTRLRAVADAAVRAHNAMQDVRDTLKPYLPSGHEQSGEDRCDCDSCRLIRRADSSLRELGSALKALDAKGGGNG